MGSVADKIAKKLLSSRGAKAVDLAGWREGRTMALEAGLGGEGPVPGKFADLDPRHGLYALAENIVSLMAESISRMREAKGFVRIAGGAEDEYLPRPVRRVPHDPPVPPGGAGVLRLRVCKERPGQPAALGTLGAALAGRRVSGAGCGRPCGRAGDRGDHRGGMR